MEGGLVDIVDISCPQATCIEIRGEGCDTAGHPSFNFLKLQDLEDATILLLQGEPVRIALQYATQVCQHKDRFPQRMLDATSMQQSLALMSLTQ